MIVVFLDRASTITWILSPASHFNYLVLLRRPLPKSCSTSPRRSWTDCQPPYTSPHSSTLTETKIILKDFGQKRKHWN